MIQLPQLQESLLLANDRLVDRARRRARRFRMGLMTSAAVVSIGGAATAGTALWGPVLGNEPGNRPSASASPVPSEQARLLGVLRQDQTVADRGAVAREALALATRRYDGVRLDAVRVLYDGPGASGIALVPVAGLRPLDDAQRETLKDALCVLSVGRSRDVSTNCFSTADVPRGAATGGLGARVWGLVPDAVATVVVHEPGATSRQVAVRRNAFVVRASDVDPARPAVEWLDHEGRAFTPDGGRAMTLPLDASAATPVPPGSHDCGPDEGGVVPDGISCGDEARRYAPDTHAPTFDPGASGP